MLDGKRFLTLLAAAAVSSAVGGFYGREISAETRAVRAAACPAAPVAYPVLLAPEEDEPAPPPPKLRDPTAAERKAAEKAIEDQLKAFKADDYKKAEQYQSAGLRENFESPEQFRRMMKAAYPQFANYKSVKFGQARCDDKAEMVMIEATVTGQDGVVVRAVYMMVKEEGEYRVGGVNTPTTRRADPRDVI